MKAGLKAVATFTLFCFLTTQCVSAAPGAGIEMTEGRELPSFLSLDIPAELATIDEIYEAPNQGDPQFILHIQDAHANYEAQTKIKQLLAYLNKQYSIHTVFVEGASEKLDADYIRLFQDEPSNLKLADALAKKGELSGTELYLLEAGKNFEALGIEDASLYKENYGALKTLFGASDDVDRFFKGFDSKLEQVSSKVFPPEVRELIADWRNFEKGRREFLPYVKNLVKKAKTVLQEELESLFAQVAWPQLTRLLVIQTMEKDLHKTRALEERDALVKFLRDKKVSNALIDSLARFQEGNISVGRPAPGKNPKEVMPRYLLEQLVAEAGSQGFKFSDYPHFSLYAGYVVLKGELDAKVLFDEVEYLFTKMLDSSVQEASQKKLLELYRDGELLRKLLYLELNRAQWRKVQARQSMLEIGTLVERLKECVLKSNGDSGHGTRDSEKREPKMSSEGRATSPAPSAAALGDVMPPDYSKHMTELTATGFKFYNFACQREEVFYKQMHAAMTERKIRKAVVITGGFHTSGLSDLFRENETSYGIVTPRLSEKSDEKLYKTSMLQNRDYPFTVSYIPKASRTVPLKSLEAKGVGPQVVADLLARGMDVRNLNLSQVLAAADGSPFALKNEIQLVETGETDDKGRAKIRIVPRTPEAEPAILEDGGLNIEIGQIPQATMPHVVPATERAEMQAKVRSEVRRGPKSFALTVSWRALVLGVAFFAYVWVSAFSMASKNEAILGELSKPQTTIASSLETLQVKPAGLVSKNFIWDKTEVELYFHDSQAVRRVKAIDARVQENWEARSRNLDPYISRGRGGVERPVVLQQALDMMTKVAPGAFEVLKRNNVRFLASTLMSDIQGATTQGSRFKGRGGRNGAIIRYAQKIESPTLLLLYMLHEAAHVALLPENLWDLFVWIHAQAFAIGSSFTEEGWIITRLEPAYVKAVFNIEFLGGSPVTTEALEVGYEDAVRDLVITGLLALGSDFLILLFLTLAYREAKNNAEQRRRGGWRGGSISPNRPFRSEMRDLPVMGPAVLDHTTVSAVNRNLQNNLSDLFVRLGSHDGGASKVNILAKGQSVMSVDADSVFGIKDSGADVIVGFKLQDKPQFVHVPTGVDLSDLSMIQDGTNMIPEALILRNPDAFFEASDEILGRSEMREISSEDQEIIDQIKKLLLEKKELGDVWDIMIGRLMGPDAQLKDQDDVRWGLLWAMNAAMPASEEAAASGQRNRFIRWVAQEIQMGAKKQLDAEEQRDTFGYEKAYGYALGLLLDRGMRLQDRFKALKYAILREQKNGYPVHKYNLQTILRDMFQSSRAQEMKVEGWLSSRSRGFSNPAKDPPWDPISEILDDLGGLVTSQINWEEIWIQFNEDGSLRKALGNKMDQLEQSLARVYPLVIAKWARDEREAELQAVQHGQSQTVILNEPAVKILKGLGYSPSRRENGSRIDEITWWFAADIEGYPELLKLAKELADAAEKPTTDEVSNVIRSDRSYLAGRASAGISLARQKEILDALKFSNIFRSEARAGKEAGTAMEGPAEMKVKDASGVEALMEKLKLELAKVTGEKPELRREGATIVSATPEKGEVVFSNIIEITIVGDNFKVEHWDSKAEKLRTDTVPLVLPFKVPNDRPSITLDEYNAMVAVSDIIPEVQIQTLKETSFAALSKMGFDIKDFKGQPKLAVAIAVTYGILSNEEGDFKAIAPLLIQMATLIDATGLAGIVKALQKAAPDGTKVPITTEPGNAVMILEDMTDPEAIIAAIKFNVLLHPNVAQHVFVRDAHASAAVATALRDIKQWLKAVHHNENNVRMAASEGKGALNSDVSKFLKVIPRQAFVVSGTGTALIGLSFGNAAKIQVEGEVWDKIANRPIVMDITSRAAQVSGESLEKQAQDLGLFGKNGQFMINASSILMLQNLQVLYEAFQTIQAAA